MSGDIKNLIKQHENLVRRYNIITDIMSNILSNMVMQCMRTLNGANMSTYDELFDVNKMNYDNYETARNKINDEIAKVEQLIKTSNNTTDFFI